MSCNAGSLRHDNWNLTLNNRSFAVAGKARAASQKQNEYNIDGVPSLGIAGRYYVDGTTAGSMGRALQIVDSRISAERSARKS